MATPEGKNSEGKTGFFLLSMKGDDTCVSNNKHTQLTLLKDNNSALMSRGFDLCVVGNKCGQL